MDWGCGAVELHSGFSGESMCAVCAMLRCAQMHVMAQCETFIAVALHSISFTLLGKEPIADLTTKHFFVTVESYNQRLLRWLARTFQYLSPTVLVCNKVKAKFLRISFSCNATAESHLSSHLPL
jgi:hypothetical protein